MILTRGPPVCRLLLAVPSLWPFIVAFKINQNLICLLIVGKSFKQSIFNNKPPSFSGHRNTKKKGHNKVKPQKSPHNYFPIQSGALGFKLPEAKKDEWLVVGAGVAKPY